MNSNSIKLLFLVSAAGWAIASNKVGNGGNVVSCKNGETTVLDFYEGGRTVESPESDPYRIAETRFLTLKAAAPKVAKLYLKRLGEIKDEIDFRDDVALTEIKDSHHLITPLDESCKIVQAAVRRPSPEAGEKRFVIRQDLWKKMRPLQRAGLLSHEIVYEALSKLGERDSVKARKLNRYLFEDEKKRPAFWTFVAGLEIPLYP